MLQVNQLRASVRPTANRDLAKLLLQVLLECLPHERAEVNQFVSLVVMGDENGDSARDVAIFSAAVPPTRAVLDVSVIDGTVAIGYGSCRDCGVSSTVRCCGEPRKRDDVTLTLMPRSHPRVLHDIVNSGSNEWIHNEKLSDQ